MGELNSKVNRAVWFDIPVKDLNRAANFYRAVLNLEVDTQEHEGAQFCVLDHQDGNGGCLIVDESAVTSNGGILLYLNVDGRIDDALAQVDNHGGRIVEPKHGIGPYGYRAIIFDSEGNRLALHSTVDA